VSIAVGYALRPMHPFEIRATRCIGPIASTIRRDFLFLNIREHCDIRDSDCLVRVQKLKRIQWYSFTKAHLYIILYNNYINGLSPWTMNRMIECSPCACEATDDAKFQLRSPNLI
jgi:hypothetical protein